MSIIVRKSADRGHADHGWLDSHHTFSFADYHDPRHMGFGPLRVINEDRVQPGRGFGEHGHRDMEIISYVIEGALEHKDSIGAGSIIRPGDIQVMSAGTGVRHSEFNHSHAVPVHFLQIWITPDARGLKPRYDQRTFADAEKSGRLRLIVSGDGRDGSLMIHRDANIHAALLKADQHITRDLNPERKAWVQIVRGTMSVNGVDVAAGDGVAIEGETRLSLLSREDNAEILLFDLP